MSWASPVFVIAVIAMTMAAYVITTWIRAKHGYRLDDDIAVGWTDDMDSGRAARLMAEENERLKGQVGRLEERISVLERIATDPAERTAREIDNLR